MQHTARNTLLSQEEQHHDDVAQFYTLRRQKDFIWEVPEELFIFKDPAFTSATTIIDMGCGPAVSVAKHVLHSTVSYTGVDISKKMLSFAKKLIPNGTFIHADIQAVTVRKTYDIVLALGALHHAISHERTIRNWMRCVRSGGYMMFREPTIDAFRRGSGESPVEQGIVVFEICSLLRDARFSIQKIVYFNSPFFHRMNRVCTFVGRKYWRETKILWYPIVAIDVLFAQLFGFIPFFKGLAVIIIAKKK